MKKVGIGFKRYMQIVGQWVTSLAPVVFVVVSALTIFRQAVISSIASTPHPELVYAILATFFVGILLTCNTLWLYTRETNHVARWLKTPVAEREGLTSQFPGTYLMPLYEIMLGKRAVAGGVKQSILEQEMSNVNAHLEDRLALPHYLAGALVGLGLVGTFVGLLGTLDDLGKLFGALANTDSSANANPAELFADMVRRLQDPMRGMGTAFVASLYGLLGSLVLGLQILVVGRVGHKLGSEMHAILRDDPQDESAATADPAVQSATAPSPAFDMQVLVQPLTAAHNQQAVEWRRMMDEFLALQERQHAAAHAEQATQSMALVRLLELMREQHNHHMEVVRGSQNEQTHLWEEASQQLRQQSERSAQETQQLKREIHNVVEAVNALALAVRHNMDAEDRFRKSVPRTGYWQDAWVKVQAYLQRSKSDQALSEMADASREQTRALAGLTDTIKQLNQRMGASSGS